MPHPCDRTTLAHRLFPSGGSVGALCREAQWSASLLGPLEQWPASLRSVASLVVACPQPMLLLWGSQAVQLYNEAFSSLLGVYHPAALGQPAADGWPALWELTGPFFQRVLVQGESIRCEGQRLLIEWGSETREAVFTFNYSPALDERGEVAGVLLCLQETTAVTQAREQVDFERRRVQAALDVLPVGVWLADAHGQIVYANPETRRIWGGDAPLLDDPNRYQQVYRGWWPDGRPLGPGEWGLARAVQRGEASGPEEVHIACFDGSRRVLHNYGLPILDRFGRIAGAVAVSHDVTAALAAETALRESEARFRALVTNSSYATYRMSADWSTLLAQEGMGLVEALGSPDSHWLERFIPPEDQALVMATVARAIAMRDVFELEHRVWLADGSIGWTLSRAVPIFTADGQISEWFGSGADITARKLAEQALRESEEKYRSLFESLDQGFCLLQRVATAAEAAPDYRFVEVNCRFGQHTGVSEARGRTLRELFGDGDNLWAQGCARVTASHQPVRFEVECEALQRWFDVYAFPAGGADAGQVAVLFSDISARREAQAAQAEAGRRKDEFLAMLGHELRNPLAAIHNTLWLLRRRIEEPITHHYLEIIQRQSALLKGLVDDLLDVSRITRGLVDIRHEPLDLGQMVRGALEGVQGLMASLHHRVTLDLPALPVMVSGDRVRLEQVIGNLLTNAAKYTNPGGQISVALQETAGHAELQVRDNGIGMTADMLSRAFELFAQAERGLDRAQGGLGIGLTVVRRLVELHGGQVTAHSDGLGLGSLFHVRLPRLDVVPESAPKAHPEPTSGTRRRLLVVDDCVEIATTLASLLEQAGHWVSVAFDGESALRQARSTPPEVVLLDIGLPGLNGFQIADRLRNEPLTREAVLVALTGYGQAADKARALAAGFDAHFVKPVDLDALQAFVARARRA